VEQDSCINIVARHKEEEEAVVNIGVSWNGKNSRKRWWMRDSRLHSWIFAPQTTDGQNPKSQERKR